ncbi:hypothetical protein ACTVH1_17285 [Gluconobacter cerinus]
MSWKFIPTAAFTTALMFGSTASSLAQTAPVVSFQKMSEPAQLPMPHEARGIALGMSLDEAKSAAAKVCSTTPDKVEAQMMTRGLSYRGLELKAVPYVGMLTCSYSADDGVFGNVTIEMSSPTVGNVAVNVKIRQSWNSPVTAPALDSTLNALKVKFGQTPTETSGGAQFKVFDNYWWYDPKGTLLPKFSSYNAYLNSSYGQDSSVPADVMVNASVNTMSSNPSALSGMDITLGDGITAKKDMENMMSVFQKAGQDAFSHNNKSAAAL